MKNDLWTRRQFAASMALAAGALSMPGLLTNRAATPDPAPQPSRPRKKVAIIATAMKKFYHAEHFMDRVGDGYGWQGAWHQPPLEPAGLYIDQFPDGELSRAWAQRHGSTIYPSVAEALTLGGSKLAVDGVLVVGEHGEYPRDANGRRIYPKFKWHKEIVKVFEASGRSVPVFQDKHLSTEWREAVEMVEDSRRLGFAFMAGSALPVTWRIPALEFPVGSKLTESVAVGYGGLDSYDFHCLEMAQCMSERRAGGEVGVKMIEAARGERAWDILARRETTRELMFAALARSHTLAALPGYTSIVPDFDWLRLRGPNIAAFFIEHLDGFKTTVLMLNGRFEGAFQRDRVEVNDFTYAGRLHSGKIAACKVHLPFPPYWTTLADFFSPLVNHFENMVLTGRAPYPIERTLLTTGMLNVGLESLARGQPMATPELAVAYQPPTESQFWRS